MTVDEALVKDGIQQWSRCQLCHGPGAVAGGTAPDLRASVSSAERRAFSLTVRAGIEARGMPKFAELTDPELDALRHYIRYRARLATRPNGVAPPPPEAPPETPETEEDGPREDAAGLARVHRRATAASEALAKATQLLASRTGSRGCEVATDQTRWELCREPSRGISAIPFRG